MYEIQEQVTAELEKTTDRSYAKQIAEHITPLVCRDIKETADPENWNDSDVRLAIGRVLVNLVCTDTSGARSALECIYLILASNDGEIDLGDREFSWTWFDDEGYPCDVEKVERLIMDTDSDGNDVVYVEFEGNKSVQLDCLDYYDVVGSNFVESLYLEIC